ncbi:hypothetical protein AAKU64_000025 [Undibacterium sp. GrIS 1.8]|uniref:hypothetical protein n=1 Tax=unclassified Undibacterium TaxID=2630295 RepID=UPI00339B31AC
MTSRKPFERAIIYSGILGGLSREAINELLKDADQNAAYVPEASYKMMRESYFKKMVGCIGNIASSNENGFGEMIRNPKPIGKLHS